MDPPGCLRPQRQTTRLLPPAIAPAIRGPAGDLCFRFLWFWSSAVLCAAGQLSVRARLSSIRISCKTVPWSAVWQAVAWSRRGARAMSSNPGPGQSSSKAAKSLNPAPGALASSYTNASAGEGGYQRRPGGSGSFGAGFAARNAAAARSSQVRKGQHKRQRRPRLLDDEEYNETAAMRSNNSRKGQTSITHLMNFSLPPRPQHHPPPLRNSRRFQSWGLGSGYHAMDKARYVHANYRFIVDPTRGYHAQAANADVHLDWDSVMQVFASAQTQAASCPICLSIPVAPRMARCGHIFCLPCLIRYMHSTDEDNPVPEKKARWKKCPICWDTIFSSETRPVRWFRGQEGDLPVEGGDVVLRLMKREAGSTLALPRDGAESLRPEDDVPWYHAAEVADYARIMKGGEDYMVSQHDEEIEDLRRQELEDELLFGDDNQWIRKAIVTISDAKEKIRGIGNPPEITRQSVGEQTGREPGALKSVPNDIAPTHISQHAQEPGQSSPAESFPYAGAAEQSVGSDPKSNAPDKPDQLTNGMAKLQVASQSHGKERQREHGTSRFFGKGKETHASNTTTDQPYYFYQALPQFYLSPLDIRILKAAFGDYHLFPATILPRVEHISTGHIVDDELRKRAKYLGHLPQGCEVNFLECDWRDVVVPEVLESFRAEIDRRRKRNRDKEAREEKDRIRAEKEEDEKRWAGARRKRLSIGATDLDPPFSDRDFQPLANTVATDGPDFELGSSSASPPQASSGFAVLSSPSTSPPGARTVWGTTVVASTSHARGPTTSMNDGWLRGWEEELQAHRESEIIAQSVADQNGASTPSAGGKKKKNKKITLMSTNIQRGA
ncbi:hypothetical protein ASPZODRAFT_135631 [Penicilliopsis zonata CBS 506.65]|uniref:RING-type domain-containing protein n=1 Tax=Penicilliopsis zonata CBS 506.65 TaxID=1073090 RepID=A0A1L9SAH1_9EURO|nr:hypothetical protein ASPZODRAFT_135631 [Penicilliopsis zonata CBS 506.65]OJJ44148.1 hypothetical protein ASPZODRAFT_135631 [Penicilliopsis zonata CBS 506.65]